MPYPLDLILISTAYFIASFIFRPMGLLRSVPDRVMDVVQVK